MRLYKLDKTKERGISCKGSYKDGLIYAKGEYLVPHPGEIIFMDENGTFVTGRIYMALDSGDVFARKI